MNATLVAVRPPYDWETIIAFFRLRAIAGVECVTADAYRRTIVLGGEPSVLSVAPTPERDALLVSGPVDVALPRVRRMFDVDLEPKTLTLHFARDARIASLVASRPGLRIPMAWDGFELAVRAVLGQQITVVQAAKLAGRLVDRYGTRIAATGVHTHTFPGPAALVDQDIAALGMPRARGEAIRAVARAALDDPTVFEPGSSAERLRGLRGIGEWTAQYIAMRAIGDRDAFPAADVGLLRAMADATGARPTPKELLARAESWRPFRAYAAQHLWVADAANN